MTDESTMRHGRKKPYTTAGVKRLPCCRCGARAESQWQICSDGNLYRPLCRNCDIALNEMALRWVGFPDWEAKIAAYRVAKSFNQPRSNP